MHQSYPFTRTNRIRALLVAAIIFSTKWKWCQVQGNVVAPHPSANLHRFAGTSTSAISRSLSMRESNDKLNKAPIGMQSTSSNDSVRRLMWRGIDARMDSLPLALVNGAHRMKRIVIPLTRHRIRADHAIPTASALVKYVIRKPIEHNLAKKMAMKRFIPTASQIWNGTNAPKVLGFKRQPENYRLLEELAVREWEKQQKNITEREVSTPEPSEELFDNNSSEEWTPVLIELPITFGKTTKSAAHFVKQQPKLEAFKNIEIVAEASDQHGSRYRNASQDGFRNSTAPENYNSTYEINTTHLSLTPLIGKRYIAKASQLSKSTLDSSLKLKKPQTVPTETAATEPSKKQSVTTFRGTLKFGDKLY